MTPPLQNPFFFESPSDRWSFTDREALLPLLISLMKEKGRRLLVYGRRRMGKTSLIRNAAERGKAKFIFVDISTAASLGEVAKALLSHIPKPEGKFLLRALEIAQRRLKSISLAAGRFVLTGELEPNDAEKTLAEVLNFINDCANDADETWTIALDEFQEIRAIGGEHADWRLRGIIQEHRNLNYIFSGSDHRIVGWMTDPKAPFFKQLQQMSVDKIDDAHLAKWIEQRAKTGGIVSFPFGRQIVAAAGPCTGDIVRLAKVAFDFAAAGRVEDVVSGAMDAIALTEMNGEFNALWRSLSSPQKLVLRAIADGKQPTAARTLKDYGLRTASTAGTAVVALEDRQILVRESGKVLFDNPFFRRWVNSNAA